MEKRKPNDLSPDQCLAVDTESLCKLLDCGRHTAVQIGDLAHARIAAVKGSVQVTRDLSFGGALRYTAAFYKSPLGHDIDGVGVIPDIAISSSEGGTDPQLVLAVETAQNKEKA